MVLSVKVNRGGKIREILAEYHKHNENTKMLPIRNLVVIHLVDELGIMRELIALNTLIDNLFGSAGYCNTMFNNCKHSISRTSDLFIVTKFGYHFTF